MDMLHTVIEAVLISFFVGAIMGAVVALHLSARHYAVKSEDEFDTANLELKRVKVKASDRNRI